MRDVASAIPDVAANVPLRALPLLAIAGSLARASAGETPDCGNVRGPISDELADAKTRVGHVQEASQPRTNLVDARTPGTSRKKLETRLANVRNLGTSRRWLETRLANARTLGTSRRWLEPRLANARTLGTSRMWLETSTFRTIFQTTSESENRESEGRQNRRTFQDVPTWRRAEVGQAQEVQSTWQKSHCANTS